MPVYYGTIRNRVVILPEGVQLVEGAQVEIRLPAKPMPPKPIESEESFKQRLLEVGLLKEVKAQYLIASTEDRTPIQVQGEPLSRTIIKERR
jgi:hypothetical protein